MVLVVTMVARTDGKMDKHDSKAGLRNAWTSPTESAMSNHSSRNAFPSQKNRLIIHKDQALSHFY